MTIQGKLLTKTTQDMLYLSRAYRGWELKFMSQNIKIFLSFYRNALCTKMSRAT